MEISVPTQKNMFFSGVSPAPEISSRSDSSIWSDAGNGYNPQSWSETAPGTSARVSSGIPPADNLPICKFFLSNCCNAGDSCKFAHNAPPLAIPKTSSCEICSEEVLFNGRKFGLLENCDHMFCLNCIREWRNQKEKQDKLNLRRCPICRVESFMIIPSINFLIGADKRSERDRYRASLSVIPCKNYPLGKCQFGSSCLYRHDQAPLECYTVIKGADGRKTKKSTQLGDYFRM
jgi:hypothetical protein